MTFFLDCQNINKAAYSWHSLSKFAWKLSFKRSYFESNIAILLIRPFWARVLMGLSIGMSQVKNCKKIICPKLSQYHSRNWHAIDLHVVNQASKVTIFIQTWPFFESLISPFWPPFGWNSANVCHEFTTKMKRFCP